MAETRVKALDLDSLIELVKRAATEQEEEIREAAAAGKVEKPAEQTRFDALAAAGCGGLFPRDRVASSARPRERSGEGVNAVELQLAQADVERDLAITLVESTRSLQKTSKEADEAKERLEQVRQILERQVQRSMSRRSVRRGEWRERRNQDMDNNRDFWFQQNKRRDWDNIDYRRLQHELERESRRQP